MSEIGKRVRDARKAAGWNQTQLADAVRELNPKLGTKQSTINSIETGLSQNPKILPEIAHVLGVREEWLRTGQGPREPGEVEISASLLAETIYSAVFASYQMVGLDDDEAAALLSLVQEVVQKQLAQHEHLSHDKIRRDLTESLTLGFLRASKPPAPRA